MYFPIVVAALSLPPAVPTASPTWPFPWPGSPYADPGAPKGDPAPADDGTDTAGEPAEFIDQFLLGHIRSPVWLDDDPGLPVDSPLGRVCAAAHAELDAAEPLGLEHPHCVVVETVPGVAPLEEVAVLRLTGDGYGRVDLWLLAVRDAAGWRFGNVISVGSWPGVGGWTREVVYDGVTFERDATGTVAIVRARTWLEDTDYDEQLYAWWARMTVCHTPDAAPGSTTCATLVTATHERREINVFGNDGQDYRTRVVQASWQRLVTWNAGQARFVVATPRGRRSKDMIYPALPRQLTAEALVARYGVSETAKAPQDRREGGF